MISKVEIKNYRIIRDISQDLRSFNILIGPNATGKSTFLDAISLIRDILNESLEQAITDRSSSFWDLLWDKNHPHIDISLELELPEHIKRIYQEKSLPSYICSRYEIRVGINQANQELQILEETLFLLTQRIIGSKKQSGFFAEQGIDAGADAGKKPKAPTGAKKIIAKSSESANDYYFSETTKYNTLFRTGPQKSALANLMEDEKRFPGAVWTKHKLREGVQKLTLNSLAMKKPCHPGKKRIFEMDGSNLPIIIRELRRKSLRQYRNWIGHLQTALPFLRNIKIKIRQEDRFLYITVVDSNNRTIPSWVLSDGTLRILALTLLAYLPDNSGIYLIEEPENGVHPLAIEPIYQSLSSVYNGQVLVATHSPVFLSVAKLSEILCFSRKDSGEVQITRGDQHPALKEWKGSVLYASGMLG